MEKAAALKRQAEVGRDGEGEDEVIEWQEQKNCWVDCEFPSECHNLRLEEERERARLRESFVESEVDDTNSSSCPFPLLLRTVEQVVNSSFSF
jgi:hypothetical protein